jgi:hypothetical protein
MWTMERVFGFITGEENKVREGFRATLSEKIKCGDRVKRRRDGQLGAVWQTGTCKTPFATVPALSVTHDDGTVSELVPAEEYTKATRY